MESRAKLFGHPIHQILIVFPLGLLATSVIFDIIYLITENRRWSEIAFWMIAAGVIGGALAAPFGWIDFLAIPQNTRAKTIGLLHGALNVVVLGLFVASWFLRRDFPSEPSVIALALSFAAFAIAGVSGWLGGELVDRLGIGVDDGAHVNAPSSLTHKTVG
ncbi:MAG: DUF2231 domain-containing protein [Acidobacteriota bacterium]